MCCVEAAWDAKDPLREDGLKGIEVIRQGVRKGLTERGPSSGRGEVEVTGKSLRDVRSKRGHTILGSGASARYPRVPSR